MKDGKDIPVMLRITKVQVANYVEKALEGMLDLKDVRMAGESTEIGLARVLEEMESLDPTFNSTARRMDLKQTSRLNPSWELTSSDRPGMISSLRPVKSLHLSRQLISGILFLLIIFSIIGLIISQTAQGPVVMGFALIVLFVLIGVIVRSMGPRVYDTTTGSYRYMLSRQKGRINSFKVDCISDKDNKIMFTDSSGYIHFSTGEKFLMKAGLTTIGPYIENFGRMRNGSSQVFILMFRDDGSGGMGRPVINLRDMSEAMDGSAELLIAEKGERPEISDPLIGYAVFLFHCYKTNPNFKMMYSS
jgi:hypothetical protein